jgi:hypothetical protein
VKTISAHFDGKHVVFDEPVVLPPNTPLMVVVGEAGESNADISRWCTEAAQSSFAKIWDNPLDAEYDKH